MEFLDHFLGRLLDGKLEYVESYQVGKMVFREPELRLRAKELVDATVDQELKAKRQKYFDEYMETARRMCQSLFANSNSKTTNDPVDTGDSNKDS